MISGYFLIERSDFRWKGFVGLWLKTLFYSVLIYAAVTIITGDGISYKSLFRTITPIYQNTWWFITTYLSLLLVAPFLSITAKSVTKRQYQILLVILFIFVFEYPYGKLISMKSPIVNFCFLFLLAGYLKIYGLPRIIKRHSLKCATIITLLMYIPAMAYNVYRLNNGQSLTLLASDRTFIALFLSISVFAMFCSKSMNGRFAVLISKLSPYTLGIYLIHCHPSLQQFIWIHTLPDRWPTPQWITAPLNILFSAAVIFIVCTAVDIIIGFIFKFFRIQILSDYIAARLPKLNKEHS